MKPIPPDRQAATPELSVVIPAHNEEQNIGPCLDELLAELVDRHAVDAEVVVVADDCRDGTEAAVRQRMLRWPMVRLVRHHPPRGFGRAVRCGLSFARGEVIVPYMADRSDAPEDVLLYLKTIRSGYDCAFGSRFVTGGGVRNYPRFKLLVNRVVNTAVRLLFWTRFNDLTNAFKAYRREVIAACAPYRACHFDITLEMSLTALAAGYRIQQVPIRWEGRTHGTSHLRLRAMGRRYLCTLLVCFFRKLLVSDDIGADRPHPNANGTEICADGAANPQP